MSPPVSPPTSTSPSVDIKVSPKNLKSSAAIYGTYSKFITIHFQIICDINSLNVAAKKEEARFSVLSESSSSVPSPTEYPEEGSSSEDTSDEAIAKRHSKQELEERRRYIVPQKKKKKTDIEESDPLGANYFFVTSSEELLSSYLIIQSLLPI